MKVKRKLVAVGKLLRGDLGARFELLTLIGRIVAPEYRFKWPFLDWWQDEEFDNFLEHFGERWGMNTDRHWMLDQLLRLTASLSGDTAECGVYRGASSYQICRFNAALPDPSRTHFLFDSFQGLSAPTAIDGRHWSLGNLHAPMKEAEKALAQFERKIFLPGWIPERFTEVSDRPFSFVHVDVDLYQPTKDSIEFFYPRLQPGGILLCDDYGFNTCPGATKAIDDYLRDKPEKAIALCSGGGFLVKDCLTQS